MKKAGVCPNCKTEGQLIYGTLEPEEGQVYYRFRCDVCGAYGKEWYTLTYADSIQVG